MTNLRNVITVGLLVVFFVWYGTAWAYRSLYKEPRQRLNGQIAQLQQGIDAKKKSIAFMQQFWSTNQILYYRSLPRSPNDVQSLYRYWLLELLRFCDVEDGDVGSDNPTRTNFGGRNHRFHVRGICSLDQLSRLLFEFYYAPFLHRITAMSITPQEKSEKVAVSLTIDGLAIPTPFQNNQLPYGFYHQRLASNRLETYHVIAERNLLQAARGGVDKADFTFLTGINRTDDESEAWFTIRTDGSVLKVKTGEQIAVGSVRATIKEILDEDVVFERDGMLWLLTLGECLNQAFALPKEVPMPPQRHKTAFSPALSPSGEGIEKRQFRPVGSLYPVEEDQRQRYIVRALSSVFESATSSRFFDLHCHAPTKLWSSPVQRST